MRNRTVLNIFSKIVPIFTFLFVMWIPGRKARIAAKEARNKAKIMGLVNNAQSYVDMSKPLPPLQPIVEQCYAQGPFPALWAVEGVGKDLAEYYLAREQNPTRILIDADIDPAWDKAQLMLHAGLGLGFAKHVIETTDPKTPEEIAVFARRVVDLCRNNSRQGYYGAAIESLGLVCLFIKNGAFCRHVHNALEAYDPDSTGFFWRGVGRCCYFHPINFMPGILRPMRSIGMCEEYAPNEFLKQTMLAGVAWPLTIVNMEDPEVMEYVLLNHDDYFSGSAGFFNGVISTVVMRYDTTPDFPVVRQFMNHKPNSSNRTLVGLWESKIKGSLETALDYVYPILKKHNRLDEVFRYQSLPALAERLERGGAAGVAAD